MSSTDTRIINTLPSHPKTRKLIKRHGQAAGWNLICLFLFVSSSRPDGNLFGLDAEDIELAADWTGGSGEFVSTLIDFGFLDCTDDGYVIHDWAEHNPWAASAKQRSETAKKNIAKRWAKRDSGDTAGKEPNGTEIPLVQIRNTPSPSPYPTPLPNPNQKTKATLALARFDGFWAVYPRRDDKAKAMQAWSKHGCDAIAETVIAGAKRYAAEKTGSERRYIALPSSWLNAQRWEDAGVSTSSDSDIEVTV